MRNFYIPMRGANWREANATKQRRLPEEANLSPPRARSAQRHQQIPGADAAQPAGR